MSKPIKAYDCKCCVCGAQAVAFWPVIDPDIPSEPYCRECLDKAKMKLAITLFGDDEECLNTVKGIINYQSKKNK